MSKAKKRIKLKRQEWTVEPEILLCDNIPKPMHGIAPRVIFGQKWWDRSRQKAYKSTLFHCKSCGVSKFNAKGRTWLEAHEVYEIDYLLGRMVYIKTVPLCHYCHSYIHSGRLIASVENGEIKASKFVAVQQHGDEVLWTADLEKPEPYSGPEAEWEDWRLVIDQIQVPVNFYPINGPRPDLYWVDSQGKTIEHRDNLAVTGDVYDMVAWCKNHDYQFTLEYEGKYTSFEHWKRVYNA